MKNNSILLILLLLIISILYTKISINLIKKNSPIMKKINSFYNETILVPIPVTIKDNLAISGLNGCQIDIESSYKEMKNVGRFEFKLLQYKEIPAPLSINSIYDKYISMANTYNNQISIILYNDSNTLSNKFIGKVNQLNIPINFFMNYEWTENNKELVYKFYELGHHIYNYGDNGTYYNDNINSVILKNLNVKNYCLFKQKNQQNMDICKKNYYQSVLPNIIIKSNYLSTLKKHLLPGSIICMPIDLEINNTLQIIINYINSKGYTIVSLTELLNEKRNCYN